MECVWSLEARNNHWTVCKNMGISVLELQGE